MAWITRPSAPRTIPARVESQNWQNKPLSIRDTNTIANTAAVAPQPEVMSTFSVMAFFRIVLVALSTNIIPVCLETVRRSPLTPPLCLNHIVRYGP